jgi:hypothetical protein
MNLDSLAVKIAQLHHAIGLRPTLERAAEIGELLAQARSELPYGKWLPWLRDHLPGIKPRMAQIYIQLHAADAKVDNAKQVSHLSINNFLRVLRDANAAAKQAERRDLRAALANQASSDSQDEHIQLHCANCRRYRWPQGIDAIATDPPWRDLSAYRWLARMASTKLRQGGLLMCQCGTADIGAVSHLFRQAGLSYRWCCVIVLHRRVDYRWRPVLVYSKGAWNRKGFQYVSDSGAALHRLPIFFPAS